jgi:hypothetical protein
MEDADHVESTLRALMKGVQASEVVEIDFFFSQVRSISKTRFLPLFRSQRPINQSSIQDKFKE